MTAPKAIIFDLDGTLIHSAPDLHLAANVMLRSLDRPTLDLDAVTSFIGNGVSKLVARCLVVSGGQDDALHAKALAIFMDAYTQNMTTLTRPYPGVRAALDAFAGANLPLGICTNKPTGPAKEICDTLDLSRYFSVIDGAEPGKARKPDSAPLLGTINAMGCDPADVLYVGDSAIDYHTALNARVAFRLFSRGYLNGTLPDLPPDDQFSDWAQHSII